MNRFFKFLRRIFRRHKPTAAPVSIKICAEGFEAFGESLRAAGETANAAARAMVEIPVAIGPSRQHALAGEAFADGFRKGFFLTLHKIDRIQAALPMPRICATLIAIDTSPADIHRLCTSKKIRLRKKIVHKTLRRIRIQAKRRNSHD